MLYVFFSKMPFPDWGADSDAYVNVQAPLYDVRAEVGRWAVSAPAPDYELGTIYTDHLLPLQWLCWFQPEANTKHVSCSNWCSKSQWGAMWDRLQLMILISPWVLWLSGFGDFWDSAGNTSLQNCSLIQSLPSGPPPSPLCYRSTQGHRFSVFLKATEAGLFWCHSSCSWYGFGLVPVFTSSLTFQWNLKEEG